MSADVEDPAPRPDPPALLRLVQQALAARGETVAVAESLTGGLLSAALSSTPGASRTFRGGLVVYATELKAVLAGVSPELLAEHGAVHPDVAAQLAEGARSRLGASWGLGITGVAGPDPQDGQPVGTVFLGLSGPGAAAGETVVRVVALQLDGDRNTIRSSCVTHAVGVLADAVGAIPSADAQHVPPALRWSGVR